MSKGIICDFCGRNIKDNETVAEIKHYKMSTSKSGGIIIKSYCSDNELDMCSDCYSDRYPKEKLTAHWIRTSGITPCCSNCGGCIEEKYHYNYCPFCGSIMGG